MAGLTWRNIELPHFDTRSFQQAGAGVSDAFSRMGQMLMQREEALRREATDAAIAQGLALQDPEAVKAMMAQGTGGLGKRVNGRVVMEALGQHQNRLMDSALKQEQVFDAQARAALGDEGADLYSAAMQGDEAAMAEIVARGKTDPLWGRVAAGFMGNAGELYGSAKTRQETGRHNQAVEANSRANTAIASRRLGLEEAEHARLNSLREQERQARLMGQQLADSISVSNSPEDALVLLSRTPQFRSIVDPNAREALKQEFQTAYGNRISSTQGEREGAGSAVPQDGMPSFLLPNAPGAERSLNYQALATQAQDALASGQVGKTAMSQAFLSQNQYLDVFQRAQPRQNVDGTVEPMATFADVEDYFKNNTDIHNPREDLQRIQNKYKLSNNELLALAQTFGFKDPSVWSAIGSPISAITGRRPALYTQGTRDLEMRAREYAAQRDKGDVVRTQVQLNRDLAPIQSTEARLNQKLEEAARHVRTGMPADLQAEILRLQRELRDLASRPEG